MGPGLLCSTFVYKKKEKMEMQSLTTLKQQLLKRKEHGGNGLQKAARFRARPLSFGRCWRQILGQTDAGLCSYLWHSRSHLYS